MENCNKLYNLKQYNEALKCLNKILKTDSNNTAALYKKGNILNKLGHYEEAINVYDKYLELNPNNEKVYNNKANALNNLINLSVSYVSAPHAIIDNG